MDARLQKLEEQLAHLQRHIEQQDRVMLNLSKELERLKERIVRLEAGPSDGAEAGPGSPADERPPHW